MEKISTENIAAIPYKELVAAAEAMNEVLDQPEFKIKTVGTKKEHIITKFIENIALVVEEGVEDQLPEIVRNFYQERLLPVADGARPFRQDKTQRIAEKSEKEKERNAMKTEKKTGKKAAAKESPPAEAKKFVMRKATGEKKAVVEKKTEKKTGKKAAAASTEKVARKPGRPAGTGKKTPAKKGEEGTTRKTNRRGQGLVARAVELYVMHGITETKAIAEYLDKEFPDTKNRSTIGHVRCILAHIPKGYLKIEAA